MSNDDDPNRRAVTAFESRLLELLNQSLPPETVIKELRSDQQLAPFHSYVDTFEPRMIEVAQALVKKWAKHRQKQDR